MDPLNLFSQPVSVLLLCYAVCVWVKRCSCCVLLFRTNAVLTWEVEYRVSEYEVVFMSPAMVSGRLLHSINSSSA